MTGQYLFIVPAVIFGSPWLLGGLLLAGIPILIHLLHKRQYQETSWAAMRFLMAATRRHSRRLRLQQLVLLAVRTLAIVLLIFALSRPFFESVVATSNSKPTHRIILLDSSSSMRRTDNGESLFQRALEIADSIVGSSVSGDAIQLVQICDQSSRILVSQPAWDKQIVADELKRLEPTWENGQVANSLEDVTRLLETVGELPQKQVSVISDFQSANWAPDGAGATTIRESLQSIGESGNLQLFHVGLANQTNAAVTSCQVVGHPVICGEPVQIQATAKRWGDVSEVQVELLVDDKPLAARPVTFGQSDAMDVSFEHVFGDPGQYDVRVRIADDGFSVDDQRFTTVEVLDSISTLLVNGRQSGRPMGNATDFVKLSLTPDESPNRAGAVRARVISDGELMSVDLSQYQCVFLCNIGLFTDREADFLARYARRGGGVVFLAGDQTRSDVWNRVLYQDGNGILPAELMGRLGSSVTPDDVFVFNTEEIDHPLVSDYRGNPGFGLENVLTFEYFKSRLAPDSKGRVVLAFENGDPCVVESRVGNGHSLLLTTSGDDRRWCTWNTIGGTFATLMNEIVRYVAGNSTGDVFIGQPVRIAFVADSSPNQVLLKPDGTETPFGPGDSMESQFSFRDTTVPGIYRLRDGTDSNNRSFAVNVDTLESSTAVLNEAAVRDELMNGAAVFYETDFRKQTAQRGLQKDSSGPLVRWLLWCVVALLLVEQLMAWRFQWGLMLLALCVGVTLAMRAFSSNLWVGLAVGLQCLVMIVVWLRLQRPNPT